MIKSLLDFLMTGLYVLVLYVFYFATAFVLTLFLGFPIAVGIYYITEVMSHYIL
jgi:hypothetical protein